MGNQSESTSILPRPGPAERVYNLEVSSEHTYFVGTQQLLVHNNRCKHIGLGLSEHIDDLDSVGATTWKNNINQFCNIAESKGPLALSTDAAANQWIYMKKAIDNADHVTFNLKGVTPEHFQKFLRSGVNILDDVPANKTNGELLYILKTGKQNVTFINGSIDEFLKLLQ
ncbi:MAG: hypothetical protein R3C03_07400 [Pirellulaceae bacterium]